MIVRDCDLNRNSFTLPPEWASGGITNQPSSLGCVLAIPGAEAAFGYTPNLQWLTLAFDPAAHAAHPEAGQFGTWRPRGPATAPTPSTLRVADNSCVSSETPFTYCVHIIDGANLAFGTPTISATIQGNSCQDSETCVSLEHVNEALVRNNDCASQLYGIELHNSPTAEIVHNRFGFSSAPSCEIRTLNLGEKIGFSHVVPGGGTCTVQG